MWKWLGVFIFVVGVSAAPVASPALQKPAGRLSSTNSALNTSLNFTNINYALLSSAVFHETNRRRAEAKLPLFKAHPELNKVAALQSVIMRDGGSISHDNPDKPEFRTLADRLKKYGLECQLAAENVATAFGLNHRSGAEFFVREQGGRKVLSATPNGEPIKAHTYLSFARDLVDAWMNSPGHRKNILLPSAKYLGAAHAFSMSDTGMPIFYCTQVFFTPLKE